MTDNKERKLKEFASRLQKAADYRGLPVHGRATDISRQFGKRGIKMSPMSVTRWFKGSTMPASTNLQVLAEILSINMEWLYSGRGPMVSTSAQTVEGKTVNVVVNELPELSAAQVTEWLEGGLSAKPDILVACSVSGKAFVIELKDQSLAPRIAKGSRLVIDPARPIDGSLPAMAMQDGMAVFGYPATRPDGVMLEPANTEYSTVKVSPSQVIGPAVAIAQQLL
jgi:SOS-response transcriptional repressor LexA